MQQKKCPTFLGRTALGCSRRQQDLPRGRAVWCALVIEHLTQSGPVLDPSWGTSYPPYQQLEKPHKPSSRSGLRCYKLHWSNLYNADTKRQMQIWDVDVVHQTQRWQFRKLGSAEINKTDKQSLWGESIEQQDWLSFKQRRGIMRLCEILSQTHQWLIVFCVSSIQEISNAGKEEGFCKV